MGGAGKLGKITVDEVKVCPVRFPEPNLIIYNDHIRLLGSRKKVFIKPWFSHTDHIFSVIQQDKNYVKCMKNWSFLKTVQGLLCTPDLVYCFFELVSYFSQRESIKYMNSGTYSWLLILIRESSIKVIPWFCTAHLLLRITRWPP